MAKPSLRQFFDYCTVHGLPFALYRLPSQKSIQVIAQRTLYKHRGSEKKEAKGFLFSPFIENKKFKKEFIHADIFANADSLPKLNFAVTNGKKSFSKMFVQSAVPEFSKKDFKNYIGKIQQAISQKNFKKIVAARALSKNKPKGFSVTDFFNRLCKKYPDAFVSLVSTSKYGTWVGVSPEILITADKDSIKTYSLAGTKENTKGELKTIWGGKEKKEQKIVSDYILRTFEKITDEQPEVEGPKTVAAGNLKHLRTTYTYYSIALDKWKKVAQQLHPTPAVAGSPKRKAIDFILQNEHDSRSFYSGFMGPVNLKGQINLFVNLRCMSILENKLVLYAGCGITAESNPEAEWKETEIKLQTLLSVLNKR